ncbi:MAG: type IV pilus biogenesis/stability protein PilW, partial [Methylococcaceae bacterium]
MQPDISKKINRLTSGVLIAVVLSSCTSSTVKSTKNDDSASIYLQLGVRYMDLNKLEVAKENLQLALKKDPDNAQVLNAFAFLY